MSNYLIFYHHRFYYKKDMYIIWQYYYFNLKNYYYYHYPSTNINKIDNACLVVACFFELTYFFSF